MAPPGRVATLILPADASWGEADEPAPLPPSRPARRRHPRRSRRPPGSCVPGSPRSCSSVGPPCAASGSNWPGGSLPAPARLVAQTLSARVERGAGRVAPERLPYPVDAALETLAGTRHLLLVGTKAPVAFFAYPGKPSAQSAGLRGPHARRAR